MVFTNHVKEQDRHAISCEIGRESAEVDSFGETIDHDQNCSETMRARQVGDEVKR